MSLLTAALAGLTDAVAERKANPIRNERHYADRCNRPPRPDGTSWCYMCKSWLPVDEFYVVKAPPNKKGPPKKVRYSTRCRECSREQARKWQRAHRKTNPEVND